MNKSNNPIFQLWLSRFLIAVVTAWNLECALTFLFNPAAYAPGFALSGLPGSVAVRGMGILFVMWSVPYLVAFWHPIRHRLSLCEALAMQIIGLVGESLIFFSLPATELSLHYSIGSFIRFDAAGVVLLAAAFWLAKVGSNQPKQASSH